MECSVNFLDEFDNVIGCAYQLHLAKVIERELNRGSGPMWETPFYTRKLDQETIERNRKLFEGK